MCLHCRCILICIVQQATHKSFRCMSKLRFLPCRHNGLYICKKKSRKYSLFSFANRSVTPLRIALFLTAFFCLKNTVFSSVSSADFSPANCAVFYSGKNALLQPHNVLLSPLHMICPSLVQFVLFCNVAKIYKMYIFLLCKSCYHS